MEKHHAGGPLLVLHQLRNLTLAAESPGSPGAWLSAASGLVVVGDTGYVVADDELHLGIFSLYEPTPGKRLRLLDGELPAARKQRKQCKPDMEALVVLPAMEGFPQGALVAIGSGSKPQRQRAVFLSIDSAGQVTGERRECDLSPLYTMLQTQFGDLNIEGAVVRGNQLVLLQRGNKTDGRSALVFCPLTLLLQLLDATPVDVASGITVTYYRLPVVEGVPLCFTDGVCLPNGDILFAAAAEGTDDSYHDGVCVGSALGIITVAGKLTACRLLQTGHKVEGVALANHAGEWQVLLVTDADDPAVPAALLSLPLSAFLDQESAWANGKGVDGKSVDGKQVGGGT